MSSISQLPFPFIFIVGALLVALAPRRWQPVVFLLPPVLGLYLWATGRIGETLNAPFAGRVLTIQRYDALAEPFVFIFTLMLVIGGLYAFHVRDKGEKVASMLYGAGAIGTALAGDLLSLYLFWELMAWTSLYLIWAARTPASRNAGMRYIIVHLFGGSLLLAGIWLHYATTGSLAFTAFASATPAAWLILLGFFVNAAAVPLHAWLPDAYPRATITGTVFLGSFTTKAAVYVVARAFAGWEIVLWAGVIMALFGVAYATLENDMRRLLSYHIISQVGYMLAAIGIGTALAVNGAVAHAVANILYKGILLMGAGALIYATGFEKLTELGGLAGRMRGALILYMVGALSIAGFPLFSGYVSKALIVAAADAEHLATVALLLNFAAIGTFLSTGLKLPYYAWLAPRTQPYDSLHPAPATMYAAMALAGAVSVLFGVVPTSFFAILPFADVYPPYGYAKLASTLQLLLATAVAFGMMLPVMAPKPGFSLDFDWFYRGNVAAAFHRLINLVVGLFDRLDKTIEHVIAAVLAFAENPQYRSPTPALQTSLATIFLAFAVLAVALCIVI